MNVHWVEAQVLDPGGDDLSSRGGSDLGAAQNPWRSGILLDEKESTWRQMDLMLPKVLSLEGTFTHLHER